jgi:hypothetical protein
MKIVSKTVMVTFAESVKLGNNNAIELDIESIAFISPSKDEGEVHVDFDLGVDITNIKFLGIPIEDIHDTFKKFKTSLLDLGIDLNKLIDEKIEEIDEKEMKEILKVKFINIFSK